MSFDIVTYWKYGKTFYSLEHLSDIHGKLTIHALRAIKKRGEYEIDKTVTLDSVDSISEFLSNSRHCFLNLSGNQVLLRNVEKLENDKKTISAAFPNIDTDDFYYQILETGNRNIVALCRKEYVNSIVERYQSHNISIIGISLSFLAIQPLLPLIHHEKIIISNYHLIKHNDEIISFEKIEYSDEEKNYEIDGSLIPYKYLIALGSIFCYSSFHPKISSNLDIKNRELKRIHAEKVFFRKSLIIGTSLLLITLLINFLIYSFYYTEFQELNTEYNLDLFQKRNYETRISNIKEKEKAVSNILKKSNSNSTYYLNRIIYTIPDSISLTEFIYQPLEREIRATDPIIISENQIEIAGESKNEKHFSNWLKRLEKISWIKNVVITDFSYKEPGASEFKVKLNIIKQ